MVGPAAMHRSCWLLSLKSQVPQPGSFHLSIPTLSRLENTEVSKEQKLEDKTKLCSITVCKLLSEIVETPLLSENIKEEAIDSLPEASQMTLLEGSHVVFEKAEKNMSFMGSNGPFLLPVTRGSHSADSLNHESVFNPKSVSHWK